MEIFLSMQHYCSSSGRVVVVRLVAFPPVASARRMETIVGLDANALGIVICQQILVKIW